MRKASFLVLIYGSKTRILAEKGALRATISHVQNPPAAAVRFTCSEHPQLTDVQDRQQMRTDAERRDEWRAKGCVFRVIFHTCVFGVIFHTCVFGVIFHTCVFRDDFAYMRFFFGVIFHTCVFAVSFQLRFPAQFPTVFFQLSLSGYFPTLRFPSSIIFHDPFPILSWLNIYALLSFPTHICFHLHFPRPIFRRSVFADLSIHQISK